MALDDSGADLQAVMTRTLSRRRERLLELRAQLASQEPRTRLARGRAQLARLEREATVQLQRQLSARRSWLRQLTGRLEALSPLGVLERGYGLVLDEKRSIIRDVSRVAPGQRVLVRLAKGGLLCRVEEVRSADGDDP